MTEKRFNEEFLEEMNEIKKEKSERVTVEDIIGLIKTDEHTDSVTLKKEAQLSICEKRLIELEKENEQLKKELFELKKDYIIETYADNPIRRDDRLKDLENGDF